MMSKSTMPAVTIHTKPRQMDTVAEYIAFWYILFIVAIKFRSQATAENRAPVQNWKI